MLLKKIILEDFGVYGDSNEFDITPSKDKPIILFGGANGDGKTTMFESVSLCLYGQKSIEPPITQKQYNEKILKSLHRNGKTNAKQSSITLEFDHHHAGSIIGYKIKRSWYNDQGKPLESLHVSKKSASDESFADLDIMEKSHWQTFVDQILPKGITKLFFFDGEKIQKIAESGKEDEHIKSSFDTLLGLDLINQLHKDVGLYVLRSSDGESQKVLDEIEEQTEQKRQSEARIEELQEKQIYLQADIDKTRKTLASHEDKFLKLGGQFAQNRQELMSQKAKLEQQLSESEKEIHEICSDTLPFTLIPKQLKELQNDIELDIKKLESVFEKDILKNGFDDIAKKLKKTLKYDKSIRADIIKSLRQTVKEKIESLPRSDNLYFNLSLEDMHKMISEIENINKFDRKDIAEYTKKYETIMNSLRQVKSSLDLTPQQDEVGPTFTDVLQITREMTELEKELENLEILEAQEKTQIVLINSKIRQNLARKKMNHRAVTGMELAPKIQDALEQYSKELRLKKVSLLESNILDAITRLFHKKDFIQNISINPETFEVKLYKDDMEITRDMLSQGELQIYATAIVWGLASTSGRTLPFMIDTPLARLDRVHRMNIVENFYPTASHQTIILSTDSEVTGTYYDRLKPYIAKTYTMNFDSKNGRTITTKRYFQEEKQAIKI